MMDLRDILRTGRDNVKKVVKKGLTEGKKSAKAAYASSSDPTMRALGQNRRVEKSKLRNAQIKYLKQKNQMEMTIYDCRNKISNLIKGKTLSGSILKSLFNRKKIRTLRQIIKTTKFDLANLKANWESVKGPIKSNITAINQLMKMRFKQIRANV